MKFGDKVSALMADGLTYEEAKRALDLLSLAEEYHRAKDPVEDAENK